MAFATADDVAARLQRALTEVEETAATALLDDATGVIATAVGKDDAWAAALVTAGEVPRTVKGITVTLVLRAMANPQNLERFSETLGAHSYTEAFRTSVAGGDLMLSEVERLLARKAIHGTNTGSVRAPIAEEVREAAYEMSSVDDDTLEDEEDEEDAEE